MSSGVTSDADGERREHQALEHAEDAAEHVVGGAAALQQRHPGDVDERVADADHAEEEERDGEVRPTARGGRAARPRAATPSRKSPASRLRPRARHRRAPPSSAADAERGVEPADARVARVRARGSRRRRSAPRTRRRRASARRSARRRRADAGRRAIARKPGRAARCRSRARPRRLRRRVARRAPSTQSRRPEIRRRRRARRRADGPLNASTTPPIAGPANMPTLAIVFSDERSPRSAPRASARARAGAPPAPGANAVEIDRRHDRERVRSTSDGPPAAATTRHAGDEARPATGRRRA